MNAILHSGDMGDIIYSLPSIQRLGLKKIHINLGKRFNTLMSHQKSQVLRPLLEYLGFDTAITSYTGEIPSQYFDGDRFRYDGSNLISVHLMEAISNSYGIDDIDYREPWIPLYDKGVYDKDYIVIFRSPRYHNIEIDYNCLLSGVLPDSYKTVFLGIPYEHRSFIQHFYRLGPSSDIIYIPTGSLLDAYKIISGSSLCIGNQTGLFSIAEALKKPRILEASTYVPNCELKDPDEKIFYFKEANDYVGAKEHIEEYT